MPALLSGTYQSVVRLIAIYYGIPVFLAGVGGGLLNIIVFLSLKTFRQSSCAFYLMAMSIFDVGRLSTNVLANIFIWGFDIDWTRSSLFCCRFKVFVLTICMLGSMTCLCLAILDQYFATCTRPKWHKYCNIKLAHCLVALFTFIWCLHAIPYAVFYNHTIIPSNNQTQCQITNTNFILYHSYGFFLTLNNLLPILTVIFGLMAYHNCRTLAYRTVPLLRRELDKQLTIMVLVQVLINFCAFLPYSIQSMIGLVTLYDENLTFQANILFSALVTNFFSVLGFTSPFYTYMSVSKRFRRQLKYVLYDIHLNRCRKNKVASIPDVIRQ